MTYGSSKKRRREDDEDEEEQTGSSSNDEEEEEKDQLSQGSVTTGTGVGSDDEDDSDYEPSESEDDDESEGEERARKRPRYLDVLPSTTSDYVASIIQQEGERITSTLIDHMDTYYPRLRSKATADRPDAESPAEILFTAFTEYTEREELIVAHRQSDEYDEDAMVVGRTSVAFTEPPIGDATGRKVSGASVQRAMKQGAADGEMTQTATTFEGKWKDRVNVSAPRLKWTDPVRDLLGRLSTLLYAHVCQDFTTQEVEAMAVNGRILVSANEVEAVKRLLTADLDEVLRNNADLVAALESEISRQNASGLADTLSVFGAEEEEEASEAQVRGARNVARMAFGAAMYDDDDEMKDLAGVLDTLKQAVVDGLKVVAGGSPENAAALITDPGRAATIIVVDAWQRPVRPTKKNPKPKPVTCSHAEQNLVFALVCSKYTAGAQVAGKKRPCTGCSLTLKLADDEGYRIGYNPHPGGYWDGTTYLGLLRIAEELGAQDAASLTNWIRGVIGGEDFQQYVTLLKEMDGEDVPDTIESENVIGASASNRDDYTSADATQAIDLDFD